MPGDTLDLSDINLPEEDADKPNESDVTPKTPEEEAEQKKIQDEQAAADAKAKEEAEAGKPTETQDDKSGTESKPAEGEGEKPADQAAAGDQKPEDKKEEEKPTPFHEHPDWIKMQNELKETKEKLDEALKAKDTTDERKEEARKTAEQRLQEDMDNGWEPKSQAEIMMRGLKYMREDILAEVDHKEEVKAEDEKAREDEAKEIITTAKNTYDELGIVEVDQRKEVGTYLANLQQQGIIAPITKDNIGVAIKWGVEQLKKEGKLGAAPATPAPEPTPAPEDKKEEDGGVKPADNQEDKNAQTKKQEETNSKIKKPSGDATTPSGKQKRPYSDIAGKTIDQITFNV